jgi:hypothetical protein
VVGFVVDLAVEDAERLPQAGIRETEIAGIRMPRLAVADGVAALPLVLSLVTSSKHDWI